MELSWLLMKNILSMALMVAMGFAATKAKVLKEEDTKGISAICLYLVCPSVMLSSFQQELTDDKVYNLLLVFAAAIVVHIVFVVVSWFLAKKLHLKPVQHLSLVYSNAGNLILPLVTAVLGGESAFYACAYIAVQTILFWIHGIFVMGGKEQVRLKKIITNPNVVAITASLIMFFSGVRFPDVVTNGLSSVGATIGPLSMFTVGIIMASADLKKVFSDKKAYLVCFGRLIVYPFMIILILWATHITQLIPVTKELFLITILATAGPSGSTIVQAAKLYNRDAAGASVINLMSVVLCIITMPVMVYVYQMFLY